MLIKLYTYQVLNRGWQILPLAFFTAQKLICATTSFSLCFLIRLTGVEHTTTAFSLAFPFIFGPVEWSLETTFVTLFMFFQRCTNKWQNNWFSINVMYIHRFLKMKWVNRNRIKQHLFWFRFSSFSVFYYKPYDHHHHHQHNHLYNTMQTNNFLIPTLCETQQTWFNES